MSDPTSVKFLETIKNTPAQIYRAYTNAAAHREWLSDGATTDIKSGGRIILWWNDGYSSAGHFTELDPDKKLVFTWKGDHEPAETLVTVNISADGDSSRLEVVHSGLGEGEAWEATRFPAALGSGSGKPGVSPGNWQRPAHLSATHAGHPVVRF